MNLVQKFENRLEKPETIIARIIRLPRKNEMLNSHFNMTFNLTINQMNYNRFCVQMWQ